MSITRKKFKKKRTQTRTRKDVSKTHYRQRGGAAVTINRMIPINTLPYKLDPLFTTILTVVGKDCSLVQTDINKVDIVGTCSRTQSTWPFIYKNYIPTGPSPKAIDAGTGFVTSVTTDTNGNLYVGCLKSIFKVTPEPREQLYTYDESDPTATPVKIFPGVGIPVNNVKVDGAIRNYPAGTPTIELLAGDLSETGLPSAIATGTAVQPAIRFTNMRKIVYDPNNNCLYVGDCGDQGGGNQGDSISKVTLGKPATCTMIFRIPVGTTFMTMALERIPAFTSTDIAANTIGTNLYYMNGAGVMYRYDTSTKVITPQTITNLNNSANFLFEMEFAPDGSIFIVCGQYRIVSRLVKTGTETWDATVIAGNPDWANPDYIDDSNAKTARFMKLMGLCFDSKGNLHLFDTPSYNISRYALRLITFNKFATGPVNFASPSGVYTTFGGIPIALIGATKAPVDGGPTVATMSGQGTLPFNVNPQAGGMYIDKYDNIYIADEANSMVRAISYPYTNVVGQSYIDSAVLRAASAAVQASSAVAQSISAPRQSSAVAQQESSALASSALAQSISAPRQSSAVAQQESSALASSAVAQNVSSAIAQKESSSLASSAVAQNVSSALAQSISGSRESSAVAQQESHSLASSAKAQSVSSAIAQKDSSAVAQDVSSAIAQSVSSALAQSISSAKAQSVSSAIAQKDSSAVVQDVSSAVAQNVSSALAQDVSSAVAQSVSSALAQRISGSRESSAVAQQESHSLASSAKAQSVSSAIAQNVSGSLASSAVAQSVSSALAQSISGSRESSAVAQQDSSAVAQDVSSARASSAVAQKVSSAVAQQESHSLASSAKAQDVSSAKAQSVSSALAQNESSAVAQDVSSALAQSISGAKASSAVAQKDSSAVAQVVSSALAQSISGARQSSAVAQQESSALASSAFAQDVSSAVAQIVSSARQQQESSALTSSAVAQVVSSAVAQKVSSALAQYESSAKASSALAQAVSSPLAQKVSSAVAEAASSAHQESDLAGPLSIKNDIIALLRPLQSNITLKLGIMYSTQAPALDKNAALQVVKSSMNDLYTYLSDFANVSSTILSIAPKYQDRAMQIRVYDSKIESQGYIKVYDSMRQRNIVIDAQQGYITNYLDTPALRKY